MTVPPPVRPSGERHGEDWIHPSPGDRPRISAVTTILWVTPEEMPQGVNALAAIDRRTGNWILLMREGLPMPVRRAEIRRLRTELRAAGASRIAAWWIVSAEGMRRLGWEYLRIRASAAGQDAWTAVAGHGAQLLAGGAVVAIAAGGAVAASGGPPGAPAYGSPAWHRLHPVHVTLPAKPLSYLGAYEAASPASYTGMETFAKTAGRQPNLALYYSGWFERFQAGFAQEAAAHGAIPLVQIDPVLDAGPGITGQPVSLAAIAAGHYDAYLTTFADQVASYGKGVVIGFGHEMNSNRMNGGQNPWGFLNQPASAFVAAWRHIVTVFRRQGAGNVTWLWTVNRDAPPETGQISGWWPGASYVNWVGIDGYYQATDDTWDSVFGPTVTQIRQFTHAPLLLSETAIGPVGTEPWQLDDIFASLRQAGDLGLVWFDKNQSAYLSYRLEGDTRDSAVFRQLDQGWRLIHQRG